MSKPRLIILFEYPSVSGGERSFFAVLSKLSHVFSMHCVLPAMSQFQPFLEQLSAECTAYDYSANHATLNAQARETVLRDSCRTINPQIIHANSLSMGKFLAQRKNLFSCPVTSHVRDMIKLSTSEIRILSKLDRLFCVSQATADYLTGQGFPQAKTRVIHNGIAGVLVKNDRPSIRKELHLTEEHRLAVFVGQIGIRKGLKYLVDAFIQLKDDLACHHWHLLIVGTRFSSKDEAIEYENNLKQVITTHGMQSRIHFLGYRDDVETILSQADLLIHPAMQEPFGRVLLEAGMSKLPILATNVGGTTEMLQHLESAYLIPPGNTEVLLIGMKELMQDEDLRISLAARAYVKIKREFSPEAAALFMIANWQELLAGDS